MGVSIALFGIKLKTKNNNKDVNILEYRLSLFNKTVQEELYQKFENDYKSGKIQELGKPEIKLSSKYVVNQLEKLKDGTFFGKISYGEDTETKVTIFKEDSEEELKPGEVPAYEYHFYCAPLVLNTKKKKETYILLLLQMTDGTGIKSAIIDKVYCRVIQDILNNNQAEKLKLETKSFNYGDMREIFEKSIIKNITIYKKKNEDNIIFKKLRNIIENDEIEVHETLQIKKLNRKLSDFSDKIFGINLDGFEVEKILTDVKINGKNKKIRINTQSENIETKQTRIDITEEFKSCNNDFEKIKSIFLREYNDIKEWSENNE